MREEQVQAVVEHIAAILQPHNSDVARINFHALGGGDTKLASPIPRQRTGSDGEIESRSSSRIFIRLTTSIH